MDWKLGVARMVAEKERVLMDLQDVFEYAFDEIFVTDEKGIVVRVNSTCERHYQLAAKELVGKHVKELQKDGIFYPSATLEVIEKDTNRTRSDDKIRRVFTRSYKTCF